MMGFKWSHSAIFTAILLGATPGSAGNIGGTFGRAVKDQLHSQSTQLKTCLAKQAVRKPNFAGKVTVEFVVDDFGKARSAVITARTSPTISVFDRCLINKVLSWNYPRAPEGKIISVTHAFDFKIKPPPKSGRR